MGVTRAIYPGSFDPLTNGHLDVIRRAANLFEEVIVGVAGNDAKAPMFSIDERMTMASEATTDIPNISVRKIEGLLVSFARQEKAMVIIRGLRAVSDFEFEFQMALMNQSLEPGLETIFLTPKEDYTYLSSRIVKEVAQLGGDIAKFVPSCVAERLRKKSIHAKS
ncbi:MAG: pantetheine-phosphate adenylyltransferase [Chthoniobacterales bacterium]